MIILVDAIKDRLVGIPAITALVDDRIITYADPNRDEVPAIVSGPGGTVVPSLSLDDQGSIQAFGAPNGMYQQYVHIWAYGARTDDGRSTVRQLIQLVTEALYGWRDPDTHALLFWASNLGQQPGAIRDSVVDYARFTVNGMQSGIDL